MEASKAEHVADVLAKTANETAADMQDMGYVLQYAGSSASLAGSFSGRPFSYGRYHGRQWYQRF
ncbi:tail tape measure protein [Enterococcus phage EF-P10]|nr:tail tape measure protein [Enterococcus phage EF-P10]